MSFSFQRASELLDQARHRGRLAHAYLVTGAEGTGKRRLAASLVSRINAEAEGREVPNPTPELDSLRGSFVTVLEPESKSRRISVGSVREAERLLHLAAPAGVTKFLVMVEADRMGVEACNAFLKTLEEPPARCVLLLLTARPELLLDTIRSRCIAVGLHADREAPATRGAAGTRLLELLERHFASRNAGLSAAQGLGAAFGVLLKEEKARIAAEHEQTRKEEVERYRKTTDSDSWLKEREKYFQALAQSEYLEERARLIELLLAWFGDALRQQQGGGSLDLPEYAEATARLGRRLDAGELMRRLDAVGRLRDHLQTNVQESLALEVGFIKAFAPPVGA